MVPIFSTCALLLEFASILNFNCAGWAGARNSGDVPGSSVGALDTVFSIPLVARKTSTFLQGGIEVLSSCAFINWQAGVSTPVRSIGTNTLVVNWAPDSSVGAAVGFLTILSIPLVA